jgi:hypothetical protein
LTGGLKGRAAGIIPTEELDFIINYDIKYRMGRDADAEDEGADE